MSAGLNAFDAAVRGWFDAVEEAAAEAAVGLAKEGFEKILRNSPQYSGDFTAGWGVGYGEVVSNFKAGRYLEQTFPSEHPFQRNDAPAMNDARQAAIWKAPKLGTSIYISNDAHHTDAYAWKIENGEIDFRTVNMGADHLVSNVVKSLGRNHTTIGKSGLAALRGFGV